MRLLAGALAAALASTALPAAAQDVAAAEALFNEGRALLDKGDYPSACAKLAESQRLDPSSGTALNLARCQRQLGKTATAWASYKLAARLARQQGKAPRAEEADRNAAELEKVLSYLTIEVPDAVPGLEVRRGDVRLEQGALGSRLPVDPGKHVITARAPGYRTATIEVDVAPAGDAKTVRLPALDKEPAPPLASALVPSAPPARAEAPAPAAPDAGSGAAPWIVGGVGVASLGVGAVFGGLALKSYGDAKTACPLRTGCSSMALDLRSRAGLDANVSNVTLAAGIVGLGVGTVLFVLGRKRPSAPPPVALVPVVDRAGASLSVAWAAR
jgi:hypothetical protein